MSKELLYKVSESIVFFTASNPLPWHFCHLSPLHNKDLERAEVFNYQEAIMENHSLLGMSHPQVFITFSVLGKRQGEWEKAELWQGPAAVGKCPWQVFPWMSLCVLGYFFPDQVFYRGGAPAQAVAEEHFPNCQ